MRRILPLYDRQSPHYGAPSESEHDMSTRIRQSHRLTFADGSVVLVDDNAPIWSIASLIQRHGALVQIEELPEWQQAHPSRVTR